MNFAWIEVPQDEILNEKTCFGLSVSYPEPREIIQDQRKRGRRHKNLLKNLLSEHASNNNDPVQIETSPEKLALEITLDAISESFEHETTKESEPIDSQFTESILPELEKPFTIEPVKDPSLFAQEFDEIPVSALPEDPSASTKLGKKLSDVEPSEIIQDKRKRRRSRKNLLKNLVSEHVFNNNDRDPIETSPEKLALEITLEAISGSFERESTEEFKQIGDRITESILPEYTIEPLKDPSLFGQEFAENPVSALPEDPLASAKLNERNEQVLNLPDPYEAIEWFRSEASLLDLFRCKLCDMNLETMKKLNLHIKMVHYDNSIQCSICNLMLGKDFFIKILPRKVLIKLNFRKLFEIEETPEKGAWCHGLKS